MKPGNRDKRIAFERFGLIENKYGEEVEEFAPFVSRWAQVWMGKGSERREAAMERGGQAATFGIISDTDTRTLTLKDRIVYAGSNWDIESVAPDTPKRGEMEITATRSPS